MFWNMQQIKEANKAIGNYFFSPDTMRFFASKVESELDYNTQCFITSEKAGFECYRRVFSVRQVDERGSIKTLVRDLRTKDQAKDFIKELQNDTSRSIETS